MAIAAGPVTELEQALVLLRRELERHLANADTYRSGGELTERAVLDLEATAASFDALVAALQDCESQIRHPDPRWLQLLQDFQIEGDLLEMLVREFCLDGPGDRPRRAA